MAQLVKLFVDCLLLNCGGYGEPTGLLHSLELNETPELTGYVNNKGLMSDGQVVPVSQKDLRILFMRKFWNFLK